jgi:hypothetical protein
MDIILGIVIDPCYEFSITSPYGPDKECDSVGVMHRWYYFASSFLR